MALIKLVKTKLNEGKQITVVRFEWGLCSASDVNQSHCAGGETDVAAEGWGCHSTGDCVPRDSQGPESGSWAIFL